jgi:hypothetical protein
MTKKAEKAEPSQHYFGTTAFGWIADADLAKCLARLRKTGGYSGSAKGQYYAVFRVPLPPSANYGIEFYKPQVEGVQFLAEGTFE